MKPSWFKLVQVWRVWVNDVKPEADCSHSKQCAATPLPLKGGEWLRIASQMGGEGLRTASLRGGEWLRD